MDKIIEYYKELLVESRHWIKMVTIWLLAGAILGGLAFFVYPQLLEKILALFNDQFGKNPPLDFNLVIDIFLNNLKVSLIAIFGGFLLGIIPFIVVVSNGFILGFIILSIILSDQSGSGLSLLLIGVGILPHGIFEIPAFLLAAAFGLKLGIEWLKRASAGQRLSVLGNNFKKVLLVGLPMIVMILFVAALLEVYVSGRLLEYFLK